MKASQPWHYEKGFLLSGTYETLIWILNVLTYLTSDNVKSEHYLSFWNSWIQTVVIKCSLNINLKMYWGSAFFNKKIPFSYDVNFNFLDCKTLDAKQKDATEIC